VVLQERKKKKRGRKKKRGEQWDDFKGLDSPS